MKLTNQREMLTMNMNMSMNMSMNMNREGIGIGRGRGTVINELTFIERDKEGNFIYG